MWLARPLLAHCLPLCPRHLHTPAVVVAMRLRDLPPSTSLERVWDYRQRKRKGSLSACKLQKGYQQRRCCTSLNNVISVHSTSFPPFSKTTFFQVHAPAIQSRVRLFNPVVLLPHFEWTCHFSICCFRVALLVTLCRTSFRVSVIIQNSNRSYGCDEFNTTCHAALFITITIHLPCPCSHPGPYILFLLPLSRRRPNIPPSHSVVTKVQVHITNSCQRDTLGNPNAKNGR